MKSKAVRGAKEMLAFMKGNIRGAVVHKVQSPDVSAIRTGLGLTQEAFAKRFHLPVTTVREWEQRRRQPDQAARNLLTVIEKNPRAVAKALAEV
jgi:putative transcriptional regulator